MFFDSIYSKFKNKQSQSMITVVRIKAKSWERELIEKGHEGAAWGSGNVLYFVMDGGYMSVYTCTRSSGCTLKMCTFTVINISYTQYKVIRTSVTLSSSSFNTLNPQDQIRHSQRENYRTGTKENIQNSAQRGKDLKMAGIKRHGG